MIPGYFVDNIADLVKLKQNKTKKKPKIFLRKPILDRGTHTIPSKTTIKIESRHRRMITGLGLDFPGLDN